MTDPDELLTVRQVADLLGVTRALVYRVIRGDRLAVTGGLPVAGGGPNGGWLIRRRDVERFREAWQQHQRRQPKPPDPDMVAEMRQLVADIAATRSREHNLVEERNARAAYWYGRGEPAENIADAAGPGVESSHVHRWMARAKASR